MFGLSERDRAEVALRDAEQRYRMLVDSANDAIFTVDSTGMITSLNPAFERMTGWERDDRVGQSFAPLVHPQDLPSVMDVFNQALGGTLLPHYEVRVLTRSGEFIVVEVTSSPLYEDGSIAGFLGVARDVTERKQAEEELHRRGRILEAMAFASERFLAGSIEDVDEVLGRLGTAAEADSISVFQNVLSEDGDLLTSPRHTWTTPDLDSFHGRLDAELQGLGYNASGLGRWVEVLGRGGVIIGHLREFPPAEQQFLESWGVRSLVVVPIFVAEEWWGTVGFAQITEERTWSITEVGALRTAAGILGATIQQDRAAQALREAEDQYRRLVELSPDAILILRNGVIEFANRAAARLVGARSPDALLGASVLKHVHADSQPEVLAQLQDLQEGRPVPLVAERFVRLDGSAVDVEVAATPFHYEGEAAVQMVARDATDRVRAEEALRSSEKQLRQAEAKFRTLVERIPAITYTAQFGDQGQWFYVSPQIEAILGFTPEEWMAAPDRWFSQVFPEDRPRILEVEESSRRTGEPMQCEYRLRAKDGRVVWVRDDWVVDSGESGEPVLQGVIFDITERKQAEEQLRQAEAKYRTLVEQIPAI
ncbi:MAG: PAS domain S-box protein, partial [Actinomycetota bacterium]